MSDELLDILDDNGNVIGQGTRAEAHARGLWHRTAHVWVIIPPLHGNRDGALLFQRRSPSKDVAPNLLDVSVGGHLARGEDVLHAAQRELQEELGVRVRREALRPLGLRQTAGIHGRSTDREFQTLFGIEERKPLSEYRVEAREITALIPIPVERGLALFSGEIGALEVKSACVCPDGTTEPAMEQVTPHDFLPSRDRYFYRALVMARRWLRGEDHLVI